jgi:hypothetical protein
MWLVQLLIPKYSQTLCLTRNFALKHGNLLHLQGHLADHDEPQGLQHLAAIHHEI